jgi:hypothetical protein
MDMRNKIADNMRGGIKGHASFDEIAAGIIAALSDMIAPLVWVDDRVVWVWRSLVYPYAVRKEGDCFFMVDYDGITLLGAAGGKHKTLEAAKAAANAHHRAAIMAAFNQPNEPT